MLEGSLREVRFAWPGQNEDHLKEMRQIGSSVVQTNDVCYINGNKPDQSALLDNVNMQMQTIIMLLPNGKRF